MTKELPEIYTLDEVAAKLGVSVKTIKREIERGRLPVVYVGRTPVVRHSDLLAYLTPDGCATS